MADVFISYKREDRGTAQRLADALEQLGFDVWWDLDLLAGDEYRNVIRAVIDQCSAAIVLWSTRSIESDFVMDEASHAKRKGKLCPALIDNVDLQILKRLAITERTRVEFGAQFSNILNHPQWTGDLLNDVYPNQLNNTRSFLLTGNDSFGRFDQFYTSNSRTLTIIGRFVF